MKKNRREAAVRRSMYRKRKRRSRLITAVVFALAVLAAVIFCVSRCAGPDDEEEDTGEEIMDTSPDSYGVFLGVDQSTFEISRFDGYDLVVVDAQELKKEQLAQLHARGHIVYSYLNVGSLEKTRSYFRDYKDVCLDRYENWPDEYWVDVTQTRWQAFVCEDLPAEIRAKDPAIDGFFLDNLDIYAHMTEKKKYAAREDEIFGALVSILEDYRDQEMPVIINGADAFVTRLMEEDQEDLVYGVNQETVFSSIEDYDHDEFGEQDEKERKYYSSYLKKCKKAGMEVFLLEYTTDREVERRIERFCIKNDFRYFISAHVNLNP